MNTTPGTRSTRTAGSLALAALVAGAAAIGAGCRGDRSDKPPRQFFPDMDDSPKWKPQSESIFYADSRTMRQPVAGTVAFGAFGPTGTWNEVRDEPWAEHYRTQRAAYLREDPRIFEGVEEDGNRVSRSPVPVTSELVRRGQDRFNIYCAACHGYTGDGLGMVGQKWSYPLPTFHDDKYRDPAHADGKGTDGHLFYTARNGVIGPDGVQKMPGYAHALNAEDAWAVVAYIRALQASRNATLADVPEQERQILERQRAQAGGSPGALAGAGGGQ